MSILSLVPHRSRRSAVPGFRSPLWSLEGWGLGGDLERVFGDFFGPAAGSVTPAFAPRVDVQETEQELRLSAELPGLEEKDFEVSLEGDVLTIKGEKTTAYDEEREGVTHVERAHGSFRRSFRIPFDVDSDAVKASYKRGVLTVTLPKPAESQVRTIPISGS